ncbi:unnamed protein product [Moneuplotes crassus]|uniref:Uncharacterized protein n=1 Tax=Euplotes crassus TaxID=5936 RepID=A0AAD2DAQ3_EUPCR|nr:unnamed protein product [Moneuplotes crassus]
MLWMILLDLKTFLVEGMILHSVIFEGANLVYIFEVPEFLESFSGGIQSENISDALEVVNDVVLVFKYFQCSFHFINLLYFCI